MGVDSKDLEAKAGHEDKGRLTLDQQVRLIKGAQTLGGIKEFGDALVAGKLAGLLPLVLESTQGYKPVELIGGPRVMNPPMDDTLEYRLGSEGRDPLPTKGITIHVPLDPKRNGEFVLHGRHSPGGKNKGVDKEDKNKGLTMELACVLVAEPGKEGIHFKNGLLYLQTSNKLAYDAVLVFDGEGAIRDILPPGDYHQERTYGETIREAEERAKAGTLPIKALHYLDQLEALLEEDGTRLAHQRPKGVYRPLIEEVGLLLGKSPDELLAAKVNLLKTFEAVLNQPIKEKPVLKGTGQTSIPPLVFV